MSQTQDSPAASWEDGGPRKTLSPADMTCDVITRFEDVRIIFICIQVVSFSSALSAVYDSRQKKYSTIYIYLYQSSKCMFDGRPLSSGKIRVVCNLERIISN